jgi:malonyl-CoA O-methyltransferase
MYFEKTRGTFCITTDPARTDIAAIHGYLSRSYWADGRPLEVVAKSIESSLCFNLWDNDRQIGFARVVTDRATYAYLCDVYVLEDYQGQGLGTWLIETVCAHPDLDMIRCFSLATRDAHGLYEKFGFTRLNDPGRIMQRLRPPMYKPRTDELSAVRTGYDRWAAVYDHDRNPLSAMEEDYVKQAAGNVRGLTVLDLGCGTGRHALWLADSGADVVALDFSESMLAEAQRKAPGKSIRFVVHDLHERLPFEDRSFDSVISGLVLEHVRDLRSFFQEIWRVTRPRGRVIVSAMHPAMFLRGSQARFTDPDSGEIVQPGSLPHKFGDITMAALNAGLTVQGIDEYAPDASFAAQYPRAEKYIGWPMLLVMRMRS